MTRLMLIDAAEEAETRVVITGNGDIDHFDFVSKSKNQIKGNIYLAKITRIEPSLQAAFVEYGGDKQGFLSFSEVHPDYYQIPVEDREKLLKEAEAFEEDEEDGDDEPTSSPKETAQAETEEEQPKRGGRIRKRGGRRKSLRNRDNNAEPEQDNATEEEAGNDAPLALENDEGLIASEEVEENDSTDEAQAEAAEKPKRPSRRRSTRSKKKVAVAEAEVTDAPAEASQPSDDDTEQASENEADEANTNDVAQAEETARQSVAESMADEEEEARKHRPLPITRRYKIQEVLRPGQIVLVQVIKEERGNKGVSLSTYISLAGRYCVLMPNSPKGGGISRKIGSGDDRKRLKEIAEELKVMRGMSAIIRTAGLDRTRAEIKRDYEYLIKLWNQIREDALASIAPALVYEESDIVKRSIRDHYNGDIETILVQGENAYRRAKDFMKLLMPSHAPRVKQYKESDPIFTAYDIEPMLAELYRTTAPLKSGGYIVINPTEALISIDVNSGKSTTERNVEETAYKTNLEACAEIARQLRLRNLGGLIVIDFIDMNYHKYRRNVERALKEVFKQDRAKIQIGHISIFGLLEMSRQRMGASIIESTTEQCKYCEGTGRVLMMEATVMLMLRNLQSFAAEHGAGQITLQLSNDAMMELLNNHRQALTHIEQTFDITLLFDIHQKDDTGFYQFRGKSGLRFASDEGYIRKKQLNQKKDKHKNKKSQRREPQEAAPSPTPYEQQVSEPEEQPVTTSDEGKKKSRRRGGRRNRGRDRQDNIANMQETDEAHEAHEKLEEHAVLEQQHAEKEIVNNDIANEEQSAPTSQQHATADIIVTETVRKVTVQEQEPQPDTPSPQRPRKGWWQRVLEG